MIEVGMELGTIEDDFEDLMEILNAATTTTTSYPATRRIEVPD